MLLLNQKSPNYVYGMIDFGNLRHSLQKTGGNFEIIRYFDLSKSVLLEYKEMEVGWLDCQESGRLETKG